MTRQQWVLGGLATLVASVSVLAASPLGRDALFHVLPPRWTGEAERLGAALALRPGTDVADIGAGSGALLVELAGMVGPDGRAFATEMTSGQREAIAARARAAGRLNVTVIEADAATTNLPEGCCDAVVMRMVWHHLSDPPRFAAEIRRALKPGGRVGVIDFAPGALPHLAADHGVPISMVIAAFTQAGFVLVDRRDEWGGRSYLLVFEGAAEAG